MAPIKSSSRYDSFDARSSASSQFSDPSSSVELNKNQRFVAPSKSHPPESSSRALALARTKSSDLAPAKVKNEQNLSAMVKKFMEKRSSKPKAASTNRNGLFVPADFIAEDLKKTARKGTSFSGLHRKLFTKGSGSSGSSGSSRGEKSEVKALTEVKANTRTLAMVLRSERELLSQNKEQEMEIAELKLVIEEKNREVEKLKDLCLKQREEIKSLKSAILFPDVMNSHLQDLLDKQGSELKQAKQLIPTLQKQVTSLTGQLQCLAEDLAEVKADKYSVRACFQGHCSSPRTPTYDQDEAANSLDFSSEDPATPGSPDDMFLKDLNPCLTPYYAKTKSKEFEVDYDSPPHERLYENNLQFDSRVRKMSRSSEYSQNSNVASIAIRAARRSDQSKHTYGKPMHHKLY
ncbi:hypothetical protein PVL29_012606 [Vitis rotundifolia]|uniref:Uncharacterized protein n=1 Tax=Vitis rotundifolia TaxID=103349 RepID=A0AA38ZKP6_VITRO|nr:hypothetical protein PVL29_012606 [Vitis rotundifolia]